MSEGRVFCPRCDASNRRHRTALEAGRCPVCEWTPRANDERLAVALERIAAALEKRPGGAAFIEALQQTRRPRALL